MGIRHGGTPLGVRVRINHVSSNHRGDYSTLTVEDAASGLQILEVELTPKQLYDVLANRGSGNEPIAGVMLTARALPWIGQESWHFSRALGYAWKHDDPAVQQWAADLRDQLGLHTCSVSAHNYGAGAHWTVYSNSVTEETAQQYRAVIEAAPLPPESKR